ncbi:MAG: hypothetical protein CMJ46_02720 [Planctomyces sp.]|nr:hypothetical protein [Planctomyces sp.]
MPMLQHDLSTNSGNSLVESINCPKCNAPLNDEDINVSLGAAKCHYCENWISLAEIMPAEVGARPAAQSAMRSVPVDQIPVPDNIQIDRTSHELTITVKSAAPFVKSMGTMTALFGVVPLIFVLVFAGFILTAGFPKFFATIPVGMALMFIFASRKIVNVMRFIGSDQTVKVERHGNLYCQQNPLSGTSPVIPVKEIEQLYCTYGLSGGADRIQTRTRRQRELYTVRAVKQDGSSSIVFAGLPSLSDAILVERQIEEFLGIPHRPVPAEIDA